jgi:cell division protein YceG involved in septum cleavage
MGYICAACVFIVLIILGTGIYFRLYRPNVRLTEEKNLFIKTGSDFKTVIDSIEKNNLVINIESFKKL